MRYCCSMSNLLSIQEAADLLGVSTNTLRRWEADGLSTVSKELNKIQHKSTFIMTTVDLFIT